MRTLSKNGVDVVKVMIDGELISSGGGIKPGVLGFTDEELDVLVSEAHHRGMRVACHARSAAAVKQAVRGGVDFIGHANYLDDEALELLEANRDRVFVGPAVAWEITFLEHYQSFGFETGSPEHEGYAAELEATQQSVKRMREAGIRVLVGGDYGLNITPHGTYAKSYSTSPIISVFHRARRSKPRRNMEARHSCQRAISVRWNKARSRTWSCSKAIPSRTSPPPEPR